MTEKEKEEKLDQRAETKKEFGIATAYRTLAFRLKQFGEMEQSQAMIHLAEHPEERLPIAESLNGSYGEPESGDSTSKPSDSNPD